MKRFEYVVLTDTKMRSMVEKRQDLVKMGITQSALNMMGVNGWELVQVVNGEWIFKRPAFESFVEIKDEGSEMGKLIENKIREVVHDEAIKKRAANRRG